MSYLIQHQILGVLKKIDFEILGQSGEFQGIFLFLGPNFG